MPLPLSLCRDTTAERSRAATTFSVPDRQGSPKRPNCLRRNSPSAAMPELSFPDLEPRRPQIVGRDGGASRIPPFQRRTGHDLLICGVINDLSCREMAGYAFRLRRGSYRERVGFNPPYRPGQNVESQRFWSRSKYSYCKDVNFVARSSSPSIAQFLRNRSMCRGQKCRRACLSRRRACLGRLPSREPRPISRRNP
jgi:hypothetical protein